MDNIIKSNQNPDKNCSLGGRDILKWCRRLEGLGFSHGDRISDYECQCIFDEVNF